MFLLLLNVQMFDHVVNVCSVSYASSYRPSDPYALRLQVEPMGPTPERSIKVEVQDQEGYDHNSKAKDRPVKEEVEASECVDEPCPTRASGTLLVIQEDGCYLQQAMWLRRRYGLKKSAMGDSAEHLEVGESSQNGCSDSATASADEYESKELEDKGMSEYFVSCFISSNASILYFCPSFPPSDFLSASSDGTNQIPSRNGHWKLAVTTLGFVGNPSLSRAVSTDTSASTAGARRRARWSRRRRRTCAAGVA